MNKYEIFRSRYDLNNFTRHLLSIMRVLIILLGLGISSAYASSSYSQTKIDINIKDANLVEFFKEIQRNTEFVFFYKDDVLKNNIKISMSLKEATLDKILQNAFLNTSLTYKISDRQVVITKLSKKLSALILKDNQETITVTGAIIETDTGVPIPAANILEKGTSNGVMSDFDGNYSIEVPEDAVLEISFIGYATETVQVNGRSEIDVVMKKEAAGLDEVVVIGYGSQKREDITTAIGSYKPTLETSRPVMGPDQMLQGRIAGVNVTSSTGLPGSVNRVSIRGIGSLSGSNEPLYVVDGVPLSPSDGDLGNYSQRSSTLSLLNPNDIASIEVLKDAASAAIYGSRATNGVILITTKKGKAGDSQIAINSYVAAHTVARTDKLKMAGADLYLEVINEGIDNYNMQYGYSPGHDSYIDQLQNPYPGRSDTDWLDLLLRTAVSKKVDLSFSGGNEKGNYYISGGYTDQQGTVIKNKFKKYNAKVNLSMDIKPWLTIGVNSNFSYSRNNRIPGSRSTGTNVIPRALEQRPFDRPYKPDGSYYVGGSTDLLNHNPIQAINEEKVYLDNYRILGNAFAEFSLTENLTYKSNFGTDWMFTQDYVYYTQNHPYGTGNGRLLDDRRTQTNILFENTLNYNNQFGDLSVDLLAGHSFQRVTTSLIGMDGRGFPSPSFDVNTVAAEIASAYTNLYGVAMQSFYARTNLGWANKYLLNLSIRGDGSSRFSPKKRYGYFPAASAGWSLSEEPFWKSDKTDLKLRVSYGATGNLEGVNAYAYQALTGGGYNYNNTSGIAVTSFGNENLTWEKANQFNAGVDLGLFEGKLNLTADYFIKNTEDLLYSLPTYATTGFNSYLSNIGSMRNTGIELGINSDFNLGQVQWSSDLNISSIKNELTSLIGDEPIRVGRTSVLQVGEEVGSFYMYKMLGIYQSDAEVPQPQHESGIRAGDVHYEDVNGDGKINIDDKQIVGSANPTFSGGFNNTFRYKNFDLSAFLTFSYGNEVYEGWSGGYRLGNGIWPMLESQALGRWTGPGTTNEIPRAIWGNTVNSSSSVSTRFLHDGSYLRFRTVSLGYNLPQTFLEKTDINRLRIYVQADNLFLLTEYPLLDPEVNVSMNAARMGEDFLLLPQPRTFIFGVNLNF